MILKGAPILLADEATSALDTGTETSILTALRALRKSGASSGSSSGSYSCGGSDDSSSGGGGDTTAHDSAPPSLPERKLNLPLTSLVIAHRLSTIADADCIVVMDAGRVVEVGDHPSLLAKGGLYASMWDAQQTSS